MADHLQTQLNSGDCPPVGTGSGLSLGPVLSNPRVVDTPAPIVANTNWSSDIAAGASGIVIQNTGANILLVHATSGLVPGPASVAGEQLAVGDGDAYFGAPDFPPGTKLFVRALTGTTTYVYTKSV